VPDVVEGGLRQEHLILNEDPNHWLQHMWNDACPKGALWWVQLQGITGSNIALLVMPACCPDTHSIGVHALQCEPDQQKRLVSNHQLIDLAVPLAGV
jgi:hypothetical protein